MSISGIVLTLGDNVGLDQARAALAGFPEVEVGELDGRRLAAVAETGGRRADRDLFDRLLDLPQVDNVEVAFVWFDEAPPAATTRPPHAHDSQQPMGSHS